MTPLCYRCRVKPAGHGDYYRHSAFCPDCQVIVCDPGYRIVADSKGCLVPRKVISRHYIKTPGASKGGRPRAARNDSDAIQIAA